MKQTFTKLGGALFTLLFLATSSASAMITAKWDWKTNDPSGIQSITIGDGTTGYIESNVSGISMFVDATAGKLAGSSSGHAQFNTGTKLRVPVVSTSDVVTFVANSYNYKGVTIGNEDFEAGEPVVLTRTHQATAEEVAQGYVLITSKGDYLNSVSVELAYMPPATPTKMQLARWTFDTGYDVSENVYTPNTSDWSETAWNGFGTLPKILPSEFSGIQSNYSVSVKGTRYWGIKDNNGDKIISLYQDQNPNSITDYTDASQHNQYFEITFPTIGYQDVELSFAFTCGDNAVRNLELVYSTDNGSTWVYGGAHAGAANWWIYATNNVSLPVGNKEKVIVRLIATNDATVQWRMNEIKVNATNQTFTTTTIGSTGWATFSNASATDFTGLTGVVDAYQVTGNSGSAITKDVVTTAAAGTGLLLNAAAGTYAIPLVASGTDLSATNKLKAVLTGKTVSAATGDFTNFVLAGGSGTAVFKSVTGTNTATVGAGKAYLQLAGSTFAPQLFFDADVTAISAVKNICKESGVYYNLAGQQVAQPRKGLYIVNGKKVIIK